MQRLPTARQSLLPQTLRIPAPQRWAVGVGRKGPASREEREAEDGDTPTGGLLLLRPLLLRFSRVPGLGHVSSVLRLVHKP